MIFSKTTKHPMKKRNIWKTKKKGFLTSQQNRENPRYSCDARSPTHSHPASPHLVLLQCESDRKCDIVFMRIFMRGFRRIHRSQLHRGCNNLRSSISNSNWRIVQPSLQYVELAITYVGGTRARTARWRDRTSLRRILVDLTSICRASHHCVRRREPEPQWLRTESDHMPPANSSHT